MSHKKKSTAAELEIRVSVVAKYLLHGVTRAEIIENVNENYDWDVSDAMIDQYIRKAYSAISLEAQNSIDEERGRAMARLNLIFNRSISKNRYDTALNVQKEINKLLGLYITENRTPIINEINIGFKDELDD